MRSAGRVQIINEKLRHLHVIYHHYLLQIISLKLNTIMHTPLFRIAFEEEIYDYYIEYDNVMVEDEESDTVVFLRQIILLQSLRMST